MSKNQMSKMWDSLAKNSIKDNICPICKEVKPKMEIKHPFKDEMTTVIPACKCEIDDHNAFWDNQKNERKQKKINRILNMSSELDAIKELTFDNYIERKGTEATLKEVRHAVDNFDKNDGRGVFIFGVTGNGKSHITSAGGNELIKKGYSVIFLTEKDLLNRLKATNNFNNHETFHDVMSASISADLLVWDDFLSSSKLNGDEKDWMFQIINGRERAKKPIWFTSNLTVDQFNSPQVRTILDPKERNWWRILANVEAVFNSATNYRREKVLNNIKGID